jgi:hypothetical protein
MPAKGTRLYSWQSNQLSTGVASLDVKIQKELAENEEGTVLSDGRERLDNCVAQKKWYVVFLAPVDSSLFRF